MRNLIEIVGIPGVGKTHYLSKLPCDKLKCVDFGFELKQWLEENNKSYTGILPPKEYIKEYIDMLNSGKKLTAITSHIVHYKNKEFFYDLNCELHAQALAHIFIYSKPEDIFYRRDMDNKTKNRIRDVCSLKEIKTHQEIALKTTIQVSEKLNSELLILENVNEKEPANLLQINKLLARIKNG